MFLYEVNFKKIFSLKKMMIYIFFLLIYILILLGNVQKSYLFQEHMGISDGTEYRYLQSNTRLTDERIANLIDKYKTLNLPDENKKIEASDLFEVKMLEKIYGKSWNKIQYQNDFYEKRENIVNTQREMGKLNNIVIGYNEGWKVLYQITPNTIFISWIFLGIMIIPIYHEDKFNGMEELVLSTKSSGHLLNKVRLVNAYELMILLITTTIILTITLVGSKYSLLGKNLLIQSDPDLLFSPFYVTFLQLYIYWIASVFLVSTIMLHIFLFVGKIVYNPKVGYSIVSILLFMQHYLCGIVDKGLGFFMVPENILKIKSIALPSVPFFQIKSCIYIYILVFVLINLVSLYLNLKVSKKKGYQL